MQKQQTTSNHETVMKLVESHDGTPAVLDDPSIDQHDLGLRVDFPGKKDEKDLSGTKKSDPTTWDHFFEIFDRQKLAMIYSPSESDPTFIFRFLKKENIDLEEDPIPGTAEEFKQVIQGGSADQFPQELDQTKDKVKGSISGAEGNETINDAMSPSIIGEQEVSGSSTDPASDDDTTQNARDMDLLLHDDPQAQSGK